MANILSELQGKSTAEIREIIYNAVTAKIEEMIPNSNAKAPNSWLRAFATAQANVLSNLTDSFPLFLAQLFQALEDGLLLSPPPPSQATGEISFQGEIGGTILDQSNVSVNKLSYKTQGETIIAENILNILSLSNDALLATCVFDVPHNMGTGFLFSILSVAPPNDYFNGDHIVVQATADSVVFLLESNNGFENNSISSGTPLGTGEFDIGTATVASIEFGDDQNSEGDSLATLLTVTPNVNLTGRVTFGGLQGGASSDLSSEDLANVFFKSVVAGFNDAQIQLKITSSLPFVERIFTTDAYPNAGEFLTVFTTLGNGIPNASQIDQVRDLIIAQDFKPPQLNESAVDVQPPIFITLDLFLENVVPGTLAMKTATKNSLDSFALTIPPTTSVSATMIGAVLSAVVDATGAVMQSFTINESASGLPFNLGANNLLLIGTIDYS